MSRFVLLWASLLVVAAILLFHIASTTMGDGLIGFVFTGTVGLVLVSILHRPALRSQHF